MRDMIIIFVLCVAAIAVGSWMYFGMPAPFTPGIHPEEVTVPNPHLGDPDMPPPTPAKNIEFTILDRGDQSTIEERKNLAIQDKAEFQKVWDEVHPNDPLPDVDFAKETVLALFMGQKPTGGSSIAVEKVTDQGDTELVSILLSQPGSDCAVTEALTTPFEFIKLPITGLKLKSEERTSVIPCS